MRKTRIYTEQSLAENQQLQLEEKPSHHLSRVLRLKTGDELILFNGQGGQYSAEIESINKHFVNVQVNSFDEIDRESPLKIHLGIALSKGDRMDLVMQKATELGVSSVSPLLSSRSQVKLKGDRAVKKTQHWQQIIISACEQSGRTMVPVLYPISTLKAWVEQCEAEKKLVLHHRTTERIHSSQKVESLALLVGPEGGLDAGEIQFAEENEFHSLTLGPRVLRTETAPLAAITLAQFLWGDI